MPLKGSCHSLLDIDCFPARGGERAQQNGGNGRGKGSLRRCVCGTQRSAHIQVDVFVSVCHRVCSIKASLLIAAASPRLLCSMCYITSSKCSLSPHQHQQAGGYLFQRCKALSLSRSLPSPSLSLWHAPTHRLHALLHYSYSIAAFARKYMRKKKTGSGREAWNSNCCTANSSSCCLITPHHDTQSRARRHS